MSQHYTQKYLKYKNKYKALSKCEYCKKYENKQEILRGNTQNKIHNEYQFHIIICNDIEQFIKHIDIHNLYNESVINDVFKYNELKNMLSEYYLLLSNILRDEKIIQIEFTEHYEQYLQINNKILKLYNNFILAFTGEDIDNPYCKYPNEHKYCYLHKNERVNMRLILYGYSIYTITQPKSLNN